MPGMRRAYQPDLSDAEWACLKAHLPATRRPRDTARTRPAREPRRRLLRPPQRLRLALVAPRRLPAVEDRIPQLLPRIDGTWERLPRALRERARVRLGRKPQSPAPGSATARASRSPGWAGGSAATTGRQEGQGPKAPP